VFDVEPLPEDSPLWDLPNVILSPHEAGRSAGSQPRIDAIFREELERWLRGEESPRLVTER
jgi:phosphoglycerate dehydrogenase-like enzyme